MRISGLTGVVLVGGRSRRMGRNKSLLAWRGQPLWRRQLRVLERAGAHPVRLALRMRQRSLGEREREIRDREGNVGPLGGVHAALLAGGPAEWLAVLAVDMPRIDPAWFKRLWARCRPGVGAVVIDARGSQPLAAIYPRSAAPIVARRLRARRLVMQDLIAELVRLGFMRTLRLPETEHWRAANWNKPADLPPGRRRPRPKAQA